MTLKINGATGGSVSLDAPDNTSPAGTDVTLTLPVNDGDAGQYLQTDGTGTLSWQTVASDAITEGNTSVEVTDTGSNGTITFTTEGSPRATIDNSGRLLVNTATATTGTNSQNSLLQVVGGSSGQVQATMNLCRNENSADISLNELIGEIYFGDRQAGEYAKIKVNCDGTAAGSNDYPGRMEFHTTADSASSPTERMRITQSGAVKITTTGNYVNSSSTSNEIKFSINDIDALTFENTATSPYSVNINHATATGNSSNYFLLCRDQGSVRFRLATNGGLQNYSGNNVNLSDEREKKNIINLDSTWDCLKHWELKKFHYNEDADTDDLRYGVIAQQVANYCPEVISEWVKQKAEPAKLDDDGNEIEPAKEEIVRIGVKEQQMMWMAIKALQEAQTRIETLETANASLEARLTALEGGAS